MKTLKDVYYTAASQPKKLDAKQLRSLLLREIKEVLKEQSEESEKSSSGEFTGEYKGDAVDKSTNVKDVDPVEIANQLLSGDDDAPIVKSSEGNWFAYTGAQAKAWIEKMGPETFVSRLKNLASKVPDTGLPKSEMPFLPGPEDATGEVADVEDALSPGGDYNVDFEAPFKEGAWIKGAQYLMEQDAPAPNSFVGMDSDAAKEFMTAGLEDGEDSDDKITIKAGGSVVADDAIPTQSNILIYKALGFGVDGMEGGDLDAWAGTGGEILDGHHRWAGTMLNNPGASLGTAGQVDLQTLGMKKTLQYLTAIGNALGNATKTESRSNREDLLLERWKTLAGIL